MGDGKPVGIFQDMNRRILPLLVLFAVGLADARSRSAIQPGFRVGLRAGPSECTPELGLSAFFGNAYATVDGWIQPWRFRNTETGLVYKAQDIEFIAADIQFRERRWGFTPGLHYDLGTSAVGIVPGAGWEFSWGDWEGEEVDPPFENAGWVGAELRLLRVNHLGMKWYPSDTRSGRWKVEYVAQFGGPKRR